MKVVILCGGLSTRLREETEYRPKPMVEIGAKLMLWHIMKIYAHYGFKDFILCLCYKGEMIKEYFYNYEVLNNDFTIELGDKKNIEIHSNHTEKGWRVTLADTGDKALKGARLKRVQKYIDGDQFMVTYGDGIAYIDINALLAFHRSHRKLATVTGVNAASRFGEVMGIIGRNGAGKTTLLKILSRITEPTKGEIRLRGRVASLLEVGMGFHPELTGRENVYLNGSILGMRRAEVNRKFDEIVDFSEVEKFIDTPVKRYSSGMYVRLAFAVAAHLEPEILLVDEVLAVGDRLFQKKCLGKMENVAGEGRTVLFVSHNMAAILQLCTRGVLLDEGRVEMDGSVREVVDTYLAIGFERQGEQVWPNMDQAPGDEVARLHAVHVLDRHGKVCTDFDVRESVSIEMEYWVLRDVKRLGVSFYFYN